MMYLGRYRPVGLSGDEDRVGRLPIPAENSMRPAPVPVVSGAFGPSAAPSSTGPGQGIIEAAAAEVQSVLAPGAAPGGFPILAIGFGAFLFYWLFLKE